MQILPKCLGGLFFADDFPQFSAVHGGLGLPPNGGGGAPMVLPGTVKRLVLYDGVGVDFDVALNVAKNFSNTGLSATLLAGAAGRTAYDDTTVVSFQAGDSIEYSVNSVLHPAQIVGACVELVSAALLFGVDPFLGTALTNAAYTASAFGNGFFATFGGNPAVIQGSICAISGRVSKIGIKRFASATGGSWRASIIKNGVYQDGAGGTVDTRFTLDDTDPDYGDVAISLPCEPWDRVSVLLQRLGTTSAFAIRQAGIGLAFTPSVPGQFMICGGDNAEIPTGTTTWKWIASPQGTVTEGAATAPAGLRSWSATRLFVDQTSGVGATITDTMLRNGELNDLAVILTNTESEDDATGFARYSRLDLLTLQIVNDGSSGNRIDYALGAGPSTRFGTIGPLAWWHRRKRLTDGTQVSTPHSDWDMQCPASWYEGFKEADVIEFGEAERQLSHPVTGDPVAGTFRILQNDTSRTLLEELASDENRYWVGNNPVYMTTRENRAVLGTAYCVFNGPIIDYQPDGLTVEFTLGDAIFQKLLPDNALVPWRQYKDSNLSEFIEIAESLDREAPEAVGYGRMRRVPEVDPASPEAFIYTPTLIGKIDVGGNAYWCWQAFGHAVKSFVDAYTIDPSVGPNPSSILGDEGTIWLIPGYGGHNAAFGTSYQDVRSDTYGNLRRVTRIYGKVGEADPDACAAGTLILALAVDGVETVGDGTGDLIIDRFDQYLHFMVNFGAHAGAESYQSGNWLTNPTWDLIEGAFDVIDEDSFTECKTIAHIRLPSSPGSPVMDPGYIGAGVIGAHGGDRLSITRWVAEWNKSCGVRQGFNHLGQFMIAMLHPTQEVKDAAPLLTDTNDILLRSFQTPILRQQQANRVPFVADYEHTTGRWMTSDHADADSSIVNYNDVILGEERQYRFAPGITQAYHLALMAAREFQHAPRGVSLSGTVGPDPNGDSIGYLDLGGYFRYRHFAGVNNSAQEIRLAWISIAHQVHAGQRIVRIQATDVEDLIDFDLPPSDTVGSPAVTNDECANAIDMGDLSTPFDQTYDTTNNGTDTSHGSPSFGGSGIGYHAAWFTFTPFTNGIVHLATTDSDYDTQLVLFTGTCGSLTVDDFNDNYGALKTSVIDRAVNSGTTYYVLVAGYGPADGGFLRMFADLTAP